MDLFITGDSNGAWSDDWTDGSEDRERRAHEEADDARNSDDPAEMLAWMLVNLDPSDPAIPVWRAEVDRRNTLTLGA